MGPCAAMREAEAAFGDATVSVEQAVVDSRHIEVQVLADGAGNVVHLFERDCSVQRRHQKVVELAPAPNLDPELRQRICADGVAFAVLLVVGAVSALVVPSVGTIVNRRCERVADDFAARQGRSDDLARALTLLTPSSAPARGRWRADHPEPAQRLRRLARATRSVAG
jgi:hypothetical protein